MCITEPFQAVSCFGTKHLCSSHAWHLKTYLYNVSAPFVFFILMFSSVFLVTHPDCNERGCFWFPPVLLRTEALAAFVLSPLLWAEVKQPKVRHSSAYCILFYRDQQHQTAVGWRDGRRTCCFDSFSPDILPVGCTWLQSLLLEETHWGTDFHIASVN